MLHHLLQIVNSPQLMMNRVNYSGIHLREEKSDQDNCCRERGHLCPLASHTNEIRCNRIHTILFKPMIDI